MAQPTPFTRGFSFRDYAAANPERPLPGERVDAEFDAARQTLGETLWNLALIQRDDGRLRNRLVGIENLAESTITALASIGARILTWEAGYAYVKGDFVVNGADVYLCAVAHTSDVLADDVTANKLVPVFQNTPADLTPLEEADTVLSGRLDTAEAGVSQLGNLNNILFADATGMAIPPIVRRIRTIGHSVAGKGAAEYVEDAAVNAAYVAANPRTSFLLADGRGFRLAETRVTPYMFGCLGADDGDTTSSTGTYTNIDANIADDSDALQAFFDYGFQVDEQRNLVLDWVGRWGVSKPIYCCYPTGQAAIRKMIAGELYVLPVAQQPGGVPMDYVLTLGGLYCKIEGTLYVNGHRVPTVPTHYTSRRYYTAVRLLMLNSSSIEDILAEGGRRDVVEEDGGSARTVRAGTPYEVTYTGSNNIGLRVGRIFGRYHGSWAGNSSYGYSMPFTSLTHGGLADHDANPATPAEFVAGTSGFSSSVNQRTRMAVSSSSEFRERDTIFLRVESSPSDYTTIAADATTGTFTWAAGDPTTKFVVGDNLVMGSGSNTGTRFEILSFSGTSNRVIKVSPAPTTQAATAITSMNKTYDAFQVKRIPDSTTLEVFPWVPDRYAAGGTIYSAHGSSLYAYGGDTASTRVEWLGLLVGGVGLASMGLYGVHVATSLIEGCSIGLVHGLDYSSASIGTVIDQHHFETLEYDVLQVTQANIGSLSLKGRSAGYKERMRVLAPRVATSNTEMLRVPFKLTTLDHGGELLCARTPNVDGGEGITTTVISNVPGQNRQIVATNALAVTLDWDKDVSRLFGIADAELTVFGSAGGHPTGTISFALSAYLTHRGWTIVGTTSHSGLTKVPTFKLRFYRFGKQVFINRWDAV